MAAGLSLLENRPLTDSPEKTPSLSALRVSNEPRQRRDEWAVSFHIDYFFLDKAVGHGRYNKSNPCAKEACFFSKRAILRI
jgi:hypothetical protein